MAISLIARDDSPLRHRVLECFRASLAVRDAISVIVMPHDYFSAERESDPVAAEAIRSEHVKKLLNDFGLTTFLGDDTLGALRKIWDVGVPFRGRTWHTSLLLPTPPERKKLIIDRYLGKSVDDGIECSTLPELNGESLADDDVMRVLEPLGLLFDAKPAVDCIVVFASNCVVPTVAQDYRIVPIDGASRARVDETIERFWDSVESRFGAPAARRRVPVVRELTSPKKVTAWVQLTDLKTDEEEEALAQDLVVGGFTHLWLNDSPQMYYGVRTKKTEEQRVAMEAQLARLSQKISDEAMRRGVERPSLFIGFEIVNDICGEHQLAGNPAKDLYGTVYKDIPSLCDRDFWQTAVTDPLAAYMSMYRLIPVEHQLPVAGVFLDLELYLRNLAGVGEFASVMLCDDKLMAEFLAAQGVSESVPTAGAGVDDIRKLVAFASKKAFECGQFVRSSMRAHCGEFCDLGLYTPSINADWFCVNFVKGSFEEGTKVQWATFNTDFYAIQASVSAIFSGVDIEHSSVLMLSKLTADCASNAELVRQCMSKNDGIWLNRFSRLEFPYAGGEKEWYFLEQPGAGFEGAAKDDFLADLASCAGRA